MVRLDALQVPTFRVTMYGGSPVPASISAVFLLPLLFQVGFGMDPFHSGLLVLAVFVGNLTIKPATTPADPLAGLSSPAVGQRRAERLFAAGMRAAHAANPGLGDHADPLSRRGVSLCSVHGREHAGLCRCPRRADERCQYPVQYRVAAGGGAGDHAWGDRHSPGEQVGDWLHLSAVPGISFRLVFVLSRDLSGGDDRQPASG